MTEEELTWSSVGKQRFAAYAEQQPTRGLVVMLTTYADLLRRIEQGKGMSLVYHKPIATALEVCIQVFAARRQLEAKSNDQS